MIKRARKHITVTGLVQGVGFRPFMCVLAEELGLGGYVVNTTQGVDIEIEGPAAVVADFCARLPRELPPLARIFSLDEQNIQVVGEKQFSIRKSIFDTVGGGWITPDARMCEDCRHEILDPKNRRYDYAFTSCTNCGPRFSIMTGLPYDRPLTTMRNFSLCKSCEEEYLNHSDRRFHAQPIACPNCGPQLQNSDEIIEAVKLLTEGMIIGLKGLGGYQLLVDATNEAAVQRLRDRKHRPEKPLAVMCVDLQQIQELAKVSQQAEKLLRSPESPIVILKQRPNSILATNIAPDSKNIGVFLPTTPLHALLMNVFGKPLVCTSGNISGEPIVYEDKNAVEKLGTIVDYFIFHNRPIQHHVDDSVVRLEGKRPIMIRRARGYVPLPVISPHLLPPLLGFGGQQKNTISLGNQEKIFVSQHIGDLDSIESALRVKTVVQDFKKLFSIQPTYAVCDLHPAYDSTILAQESGLPLIQVQHHEAHVAACLVDNQFTGEAMGVAWDGTGLGYDGTLWGGEFFQINGIDFNRFGSLRPFQLIGGERAIKEPKRIALALLFETYGEECFEFAWTRARFTSAEIEIFKTMLERKVQAVITSSMGRLFDGVAALAGLKDEISYEGQAAMILEDNCVLNDVEPFDFECGQTYVKEIDWRPIIRQIVDSPKNPHLISSRFHRTLAEMIYSMIQNQSIKTIVLTGGCFQNIHLLEAAIKRLRNNYQVLVHKQLPPNDGGLSAGQIYLAGRRLLCV